MDKEKLGRGIKLTFTTTPKLNEPGQTIIRRLIYDDATVFRKYFGNVMVITHNDTVTIFCTNSKFYVNSSNSEKKYNQIFYEIIDRLSVIANKALLKSVNLNEFYILYRIKPQE